MRQAILLIINKIIWLSVYFNQCPCAEEMMPPVAKYQSDARRKVPLFYWPDVGVSATPCPSLRHHRLQVGPNLGHDSRQDSYNSSFKLSCREARLLLYLGCPVAARRKSLAMPRTSHPPQSKFQSRVGERRGRGSMFFWALQYYNYPSGVSVAGLFSLDYPRN